jgi:hypothetical protein
MRQLLISFGLVYGNLNALVLSLVFALTWAGSESGLAQCRKVSLELLGCRVALVLVVLVVFGGSTILSCIRLMQVRKAFQENVSKDDKP